MWPPDRAEPSARESQEPAKLVARILAGDRGSEEVLVQRYQRGVTLIVRQAVRNSATAQDLVQEVLVLAIEKIRKGEIREPEKLSAFLCGLARNVVIGHFRRAVRHEGGDPCGIGDSVADSARRPDQEMERQEQVRLIRQVLDEMPSHRDREILRRYYLAEEEKEAIREDLSLSSLHFNRVLYRARERFRELYETALGRLER